MRSSSAVTSRGVPSVSTTEKNRRSRPSRRKWIGITGSSSAGVEPHAHPLLVHGLFSRIIGFDPDRSVIEAGRSAMQPALDVIDRHLRTSPHLAGEAFGLADVTWMPYVDYLLAIHEGDAVTNGRPGLSAWWDRVSGRPAWQAVAHTGLQPYDPVASADRIAVASRGTWSSTPG
jgi:glutathione S-transferase